MGLLVERAVVIWLLRLCGQDSPVFQLVIELVEDIPRLFEWQLRWREDIASSGRDLLVG